MVSVRPAAAGLALLALVPVAAFLVARSTPVVALSLVSVLLIAGSVYYMFSPAAGDGEHAAEAPE